MALRDWYPTDPESCLLLADVIVVLHFAIVLYVILGQVVVLAGWLLRWQWVRNRWFRLSHFALIAFVATQACFGQLCPLTIWEYELRELGGQPIEHSSFIAYWAHELLFIDVEPEALTVPYVVFALLVLVSLRLVPVRWRRGSS
jgi:hypothetical protein